MKLRLCGSVADEQFEGGALAGFAGLEIAGRHGELVEIGEEPERHYFFFSGGCGGCSFMSPAAVRSSSTTHGIQLIQG